MTKEEKEQYFACHYGQKVMMGNNAGSAVKVDRTWNWEHISFYLELAPLSSITDEDAVEVARVVHQADHFKTIKQGRRYVESVILSIKQYHEGYYYPYMKCISVIDYLRSKGYALPWRGYSVDQLIEQGWLKLKT